MIRERIEHFIINYLDWNLNLSVFEKSMKYNIQTFVKIENKNN